MSRLLKTVTVQGQDIDLVQSSCLHDPDNDNGRHMCIHGTGYLWVKLDGEWFSCGERSTIKTIKLLESYATIKELRDYLELIK